MALGQKAKFLNLVDKAQADEQELTTLYSIEIVVMKSPKKKVKCGAISVFRLNSVAQDFASQLDPKKFRPEYLRHAQERAKEIQEEINKKTEVMVQDPTYFRETDGQWIPWAIDEALRLYDRFGGSATIKLKCPKLKISVTRSAKQVAAMRSDYEQLFPVMKDIDALLDREYAYDPWRQAIRRGRIGADMAKR
jgi:hypothetical protein